MNGSTQQGLQISRGFEFDFTPASAGSTAMEQARVQLQEARFALETTLAAVLEACPGALDAAFANECAGMVLKYRRRALERLEQSGS